MSLMRLSKRSHVDVPARLLRVPRCLQLLLDVPELCQVVLHVGARSVDGLLGLEGGLLDGGLQAPGC